MENKSPEARIALLFSEMAAVGPFLPGSVRRSLDRRKDAQGHVRVYEGQPILNYRVGNRRKDKRIPKEAYPRVKELTENYRRFETLRRQLEAAMVEAHLPGDKNKA